jgi:hypothetical protein
MASITAARRVVREAGRFRVADLPVSGDVRLGLVLGRALAHEIGHFLLDTRTHAARGLMRSNFDARQFADPRANAAFALDPHASEWLGKHQPRGFTSFASHDFSYFR